jgi:hypothetical protein
MVRFGKTSANKQRWRCRDCKQTCTEQPKEITISDRVLNAVYDLPQVKTDNQTDGDKWTADYLIEQILRNYLRIEADYTSQDLAVVSAGHIIS